MNPYATLGAGLASSEAAELSARLCDWHDAMVAHERRLRSARLDDTCGEDCPHADAPSLWSEAVAVFGARAESLTFLRSRAQDPRAFANGNTIPGIGTPPATATATSTSSSTSMRQRRPGA